MNDFDFFTVSASSSSIKALMKLPNVKREKIETRVYYGGGRFPKTFYKVNLKFFDVMEFGHFGARQRANEYVEAVLATKPAEVILSVKFQPVD
jgi:hypothetical protein